MDRLYRFLLTIIVICAVILIGMHYSKKFLSETLTAKAVETAVQDDVSNDSARKIVDTLDKNEKETLTKIIDNHMDELTDKDTIKKLIKNKSISQIKKFIKTEFTEDEIKDIKEIYRNHRDEINIILAEAEKEEPKETDEEDEITEITDEAPAENSMGIPEEHVSTPEDDTDIQEVNDGEVIEEDTVEEDETEGEGL